MVQLVKSETLVTEAVVAVEYNPNSNTAQRQSTRRRNDEYANKKTSQKVNGGLFISALHTD